MADIQSNGDAVQEKVETKVCATCEIAKPIAEFRRNRRYKSGHVPQCRPCERDKPMPRKPHPKRGITGAMLPEEKRIARKTYMQKYHRKRRADKRAAGECLRCDQPAVVGRELCAAHVGKAKEYLVKNRVAVNRQAKVARDRRISNGLCACCTNQTVPGYRKCERHLRLIRDKKNEFRKVGLCPRCGGMPVTGNVYCEAHRKHSGAHRQYILNRRANGVCDRCGLVPPAAGRFKCAACLAKQTAVNTANSRAWKQSGLCKKCGDLPLAGSDCCEVCYLRGMARDHLGDFGLAGELKAKFIGQDGLCAYSGLPISLGSNSTLDHMTPISRGGKMEIENVCWVLREVNQMKRDLSLSRFLELVAIIQGNFARKRKDDGDL